MRPMRKDGKNKRNTTLKQKRYLKKVGPTKVNIVKIL